MQQAAGGDLTKYQAALLTLAPGPQSSAMRLLKKLYNRRALLRPEEAISGFNALGKIGLPSRNLTPIAQARRRSSTRGGPGFPAHQLLVVHALPPGSELVCVPPDLQVLSWGAGAPGIEAVMHPAGVFLPLAHFLVERPRNHDPPHGLRKGLARQYEKLAPRLSHLPPGVEVMHIEPTYHLPKGMSMLNSLPLRLPERSDAPGARKNADDDCTAATAPAATFMEIDGCPDASEDADSLGVIANASPAQIAEYLSEAAASSQSGVNELQPASAVAAVPALEQGVLMDSESAAAPESTGHQRGRTARERNIPSRYRADVFHT